MNVLSSNVHDERRREVAQALSAHRQRVGDAFARSFEQIPRWKALADEHAQEREEHVATHFIVFADYAAEYFERDDATFKHLFVGEAIKALYEPASDVAAAAALARNVLAEQRASLRTVLTGSLSDPALARLDELMVEVEQILSREAPKTQRILLVGDCLFLDIVPFVVADALAQGIRLIPEYVTSKNPVALRDELRAASANKYDLVFFSPFSYEFSPAYSQLSEWRNALMSESAVREVAREAWEDARTTIDLLADLFDCPIHVHNSSAIVREESAAKRVVKLKAAARQRLAAKAQVNEALAAHLQARNAETFQHLFLLDEDALVQAVGELEAGAYFYKTALQHPARLGQILAGEYADILYVSAWLMKRKVVVCDLDNTLWDGVIGEGAVSHFHDRQQTLLALKKKGVVLAINSKNDPANVHWRDGSLGDDDFVAASISWDPKVHGMKRIQSALNLKMKDYVFVDDREDERELMHMTYPDVACVDATLPQTWRRFALWARLLEEDLEMDRTLMYKQREERKAFVKEDVATEEERTAMFASLGLKLTILAARPQDLKRISELINRTNQFNLEGSRVTLKEVTDWSQSDDHLIVVGQTSDRFGDMGTTCVAAVQFDGEEMRLLPFVLSCRVFGYGIERGVMNHLRRVARARGVKRIVGRYTKTPHNAPCQNFLPENGFVEDGAVWRADVERTDIADPHWLEVATA